MPFSLTPRWVFQHYSEITPDWLRQQGITLLLSDLDFTLAAKKTRRPDQSLRDWIAALRNAGIGFMIVSNNRSGSRVTEFCADLGVPYQGRAGKPSPRGLEAAMARAGADRVCTAMLGDKLLTDILAANRAGVLPLMVEPVGGAVTAWQKVLHALQAPFKAICRRKMEFQHVKPGKGAAFVRTKYKNVMTGAIREESFNPTAKFEQATVERKDAEYSYNDGDLYYFMDPETYDMVPLNRDVLGDAFRFVKENTVCKLVSYKGSVFTVEVPNFMDLEVTETEPGLRGDTATNVTKPATLETGAEVKVPLFINTGDKIQIDTRTGEYIGRSKE